MDVDVQNKVVIVTGAARGLGREYVQRFAEAGARVVAADKTDCGETINTLQDKSAVIAVNVDVDVDVNVGINARVGVHT